MEAIGNILLTKRRKCFINGGQMRDCYNGVEEMRKIVYFLDFSDNVGGSSKVLLTQAYIMKQRGYQVKLIIPVQEGKLPIKECIEICKRYELAFVYAYYTADICMENIDILKALEDYGDIVKLLETDKPDLIHSAQLNIAVEFAARNLRIPHLMNIYPVDRETFNLNWMNIYPQYHSADSLLFSERWRKGLGISSRCIRVAYESNKNNIKYAESKECTTITVLSIGVFNDYKNQLEIIKFLLKCKLNGKNVKLIFLGDYNNSYGKKCREFIDKHDLWDCVKFEGFVLNIEDYFKKADLFILASRKESYPGVIVESMANEVPIISTPVAGVPELLVDGKNGFLTEGYGEQYIYEAFLRYLTLREKDQVKQIVKNAKITYLQNHTYAVVGEKLEDYYQWIIQDYRSRNIPYLTVNEVAQEFQKSLADKKQEKSIISMRSQVWFLYHVFSKINRKENRKIAIWGAGHWGSMVLEWIHVWGKEVEIMGFIDTKKQGTYLGYPIFGEKEKVVEECGTIFVAMGNVEAIHEVMSYLEICGKVRNQDFFLSCNSPVI